MDQGLVVSPATPWKSTMPTLKTSLSVVGSPPRPTLPSGLYHISEILPHVHTRHGLSSSDKPHPVRPPAPNANDFFNVMITSLESALAS